MLWWKRKEKTRFEKISPKYSRFMTPLPFSGINVSMYPFWNIIMIAPKIMSRIEMNRTVIMVICKALVFSMLLKEKAAPERKKTPSQN